MVDMYPERVGKIALDGVGDAVAWASEPSYKFMTRHADSAEGTFTRFTEYCAEVSWTGNSLMFRQVVDAPSHAA
jgi:hypothetical protein